VSRKRSTGLFTNPSHDVEHARREKVGCEFGEAEDGQRSVFGWLEDQRVSGGQCHRNLAAAEL